ncbi:MAG: GNAT family N-acetyltransferase [Xanthomonadales bacterium]|nr:GNAT family N-acetyltransferase [Gammaproteobacteria bacterium]NNE05812.1 GNAT family N-acetyltransferase [Xanthomonadales bacterium]NNL95151.1 GNAT family N-acetyltransferase [Xanthomonadales bacterium]
MHHIPSPEMPEVSWENYFVARVDDQVVGFCGFKILSETEAKTELMAVDSSCRGLGVGYKLQQHRMEVMHSRGIRKLTTNTDLPATIAFYKKHFGYREVGKLDKIHEFSDPAINEWTTLEVDLVAWHEAMKRQK